MTLQQNDFTEAPFLWPRLRLFLSADLIGSTKLKQSRAVDYHVGDDHQKNRALGAEWFSPITDFYKLFDYYLRAAWKEHVESVSLAESESDPNYHNIELWKTNGDELIYTKILKDIPDCAACLKAWKQAVVDVRREFRDRNFDLNLKSTAWLAGFPIRNHEIIFEKGIDPNERQEENDTYRDNLLNHFNSLKKWYDENERRHHLIRDFIGPSIDTGFRLTKMASVRKFPISIDLAYLLTRDPDISREFKIFYEGDFELKGILGGHPYPVFWLEGENQKNLNIQRDALKGNYACNPNRVYDFCDAFFDNFSDFGVRPFLIESSDKKLSYIPPYHEEKIKGIKDQWIREKSRQEAQSEQNSPGREPPQSNAMIEQELDENIVQEILKGLTLDNSGGSG